MNVANLENCKTLYELSGWKPDDWDVVYWEEPKRRDYIAPKYDLGYLLRKLPDRQPQGLLRLFKGVHEKTKAVHWFIGYDALTHDAFTPEDAACRLAIELFKEGVLPPERRQ